ncbi:MAG: CDP-alcohol phosphatidyltransferase family protein [Aquificaceae bacterium]
MVNLITALRLFLVVPVLLSLENSLYVLAGILIILAWISDWLDGMLARKSQKTDFGAHFDPFVDKVFVLLVLSFFLSKGEIELLPYVLLLFREFSASFLRSESARALKSLPASPLGKLKAGFEFLTLLSLCFGGPSETLLWLSVIFAYASLYEYAIKYWLLKDA